LPESPAYHRHTIYEGGPAERMDCVVGDLDNNGVDEFIIASRNPNELHWFGRTSSGTWIPHLMDDTFPSISVGSALVDLTGSGTLDLISGTSDQGNYLFWWECPEDPSQIWKRHEVLRLPDNRIHDLMLADIDDDGIQELYVWNPDARLILGVRVPEDPYQTPWPGVYPVATGVNEQALAAADVDGDGRLELIAGCSWYRQLPTECWERHVYAEGYGGVRLAAADFDLDGQVEVALCEVALDIGQTYGRLAIFKPGADVERPWEAQVLDNQLLDAHTLQVADFDGDGRPDIYVGEMGRGDWTKPHLPRQLLFMNRVNQWETQVIDSGIGTHEAQIIKLDGKVGIVSKPYRWLQDTAPRPQEADNLYLYLPE